MLAGLLLGSVAFLAGSGAIILVIGGDGDALSWGAVAIGLTVGCVPLIGWGLRESRLRALPGPIRHAVLELPAAMRIRYSRAGSGNPVRAIAWVIYVIGVATGVLMTLAGPIGLVVIGAAGLIAGVLLAMARDGRGQRTAWISVVIGPLLLAALPLVSDAPIVERLGAALTTLLITGLPVLVGFGLTLAVAEFYRRTRPIDLTGVARMAPLIPELGAATRHGRAPAVVREYPPHLLAYVAQDQAALEGAGYELRRSYTLVTLPASHPLTEIVGRLLGWGASKENWTWSVYVRRAASF